MFLVFIIEERSSDVDIQESCRYKNEELHIYPKQRCNACNFDYSISNFTQKPI